MRDLTDIHSFLHASPKQARNDAVHVNSAEISPNLAVSGCVTAAFWTP